MEAEQTHQVNLTEELMQKLCQYISKADFSVVEFYNLEPELREHFPYNGGDEDWFVIMRDSKFLDDLPLPRWVEYLDASNEPDHYIVNETLHVFVGNHS
jgi:hypothetical protein